MAIAGILAVAIASTHWVAVINGNTTRHIAAALLIRIGIQQTGSAAPLVETLLLIGSAVLEAKSEGRVAISAAPPGPVAQEISEALAAAVALVIVEVSPIAVVSGPVEVSAIAVVSGPVEVSAIAVVPGPVEASAIAVEWGAPIESATAASAAAHRVVEFLAATTAAIRSPVAAVAHPA